MTNDITATHPDDDVWMTAPEVAEYLNVQLAWLYDKVSARAIPHAKFGNQLRFNRGKLKEWIKELER